MRPRISAFWAVLFVLALLPATTGCAARLAPLLAPVPPAIAKAEARQIFHAYVDKSQAARAGQDERLALKLTRDAQTSLTMATYRRATHFGEEVPTHSYGEPALYIPRLEEYPKWFVVVVPVRTDSHEKTQLMMFERPSSEDPWKLGFTSTLDEPSALPRIALDRDGYAKPVEPDSTELVTQPQAVRTLHATVAEEGPASVAGRYMPRGPYTSGYRKTDRELRRAFSAAGLEHDTIYKATDYPVHALRTTDGGALVFYSIDRDVRITADRKTDRFAPAVPKRAKPFLIEAPDHGDGEDDTNLELGIVAMQTYVATVPPEPGAPTSPSGSASPSASEPTNRSPSPSASASKGEGKKPKVRILGHLSKTYSAVWE